MSTFTTHPWEERDKAQGLKTYQYKTEKSQVQFYSTTTIPLYRNNAKTEKQKPNKNNLQTHTCSTLIYKHLQPYLHYIPN